MITNNPKIEIWQDKYALISDDTHFTPWAKESGTIAFHHHIKRYSKYIPKGGTVVDCGANQGMYSAAFCELVGEAGTVYSFEPNQLPFVCLTINVPLAKSYMIALGESEGTCRVVENKKNYGASYIQEGNTTLVKPLDFLQLEQCDLIKLDVEGAEMSVLKGAHQTITKTKPTLVLEVSELNLSRFNLVPDDIYNYIKSINYHIIDQWGNPRQHDIICVFNQP